MFQGHSRMFAVIVAVLLAAPALAQAQVASRKPAAAITLTSTPSPPKAGANTFAVTVKGTDGRAITDAAVSVTLFMAAMPEMKMPAMKNTVTLKHVKDGTYSGPGNVMMAGMWDATVTVTRAGTAIATKKFPLSAR
jgi:hypothetical protein